MSGYFVMVIGAAALVFSASLLTPHNEKMEKTLRFALALVLVGVIFRPFGELPQILWNLKDDIDRTEESLKEEGKDGWLENQKEEIVAEGIAIAIAERFSLSVKDIAVKVTLGGGRDAPTLEYVKVSLQNEASYANIGGILRYVKNNYTENCEVIPHAKE